MSNFILKNMPKEYALSDPPSLEKSLYFAKKGFEAQQQNVQITVGGLTMPREQVIATFGTDHPTDEQWSGWWGSFDAEFL